MPSLLNLFYLLLVVARVITLDFLHSVFIPIAITGLYFVFFTQTSGFCATRSCIFLLVNQDTQYSRRYAGWSCGNCWQCVDFAMLGRKLWNWNVKYNSRSDLQPKNVCFELLHEVIEGLGICWILRNFSFCIVTVIWAFWELTVDCAAFVCFSVDWK